MSESTRTVVAGFDGGGTKIECWVADLNGQVLGRGHAVGANLLAANREMLRAGIRESLIQALAAAGRDAIDLRAACLSLAGYWPGRPNAPTVDEFRDLFPATARLRLESDVAAALQGAAPHGPAVVLIAGTGSVAYGRNAQGKMERAGGWGHLLGDEGSGYWIGQHGVLAALRSMDRRSPKTVLEQTIPSRMNCKSPAELIPLAYQTQQLDKRGMAKLAPLVVEAAEQGDGIAVQILREAGEELARLVAAVARHLEMAAAPFPVFLTGGIFESGEAILAPLRANLAVLSPYAAPRRATVRPARGAVLFALEMVAEETTR